MATHPIACNLHAFRSALTEETTAMEVLEELHAIGYRHVIVGGALTFPAKTIRRMLDDVGLTCCSYHAASDPVLGMPDQVMEEAHILGTSLVATGWPVEVAWDAGEPFEAFRTEIGSVAERFARAELTLAYRHHGFELARTSDGTYLEQLLVSSPDLQLELSTYWLQVCGASPAAWCERLPGRVPLMLVQDVIGSAANGPAFADLGQGNLDWGAIFEAGQWAGCQWYVHDRDDEPSDPLASAAGAFVQLRAALETGS